MYIINVIKNIFSVLDSRTKKQYLVLQLFFLFSAFMQVAGIASIGPFIAIISNQEIIHTNNMLSFMFETGGFESNLQFIIAVATGSLVMILISNGVAGLTIWLTFKFSVNLGSKLQKEIYGKFIHKDYLFHKTRNYNELIAIVSQQVPRFVYMLFQPFLLLTSQLFVAFIILGGLIMLDILLATIAAVLVGGSYLFTYLYLKKTLVHHGSVVTERNDKIQAILSESFIGIKDIKLGSMEQNYLSRFDKINVKGLKSQAFIALSGDLPKFVIESISFGAIILLALVLLITQNDIESVVPVLSIYALAGYKLLPTMQQIYKSLSSLSGHGSVANTLLGYQRSISDEVPLNMPVEKLDMNKIDLKNICFSYPNSTEPALSNVSIILEKGFIYSLAGHSGSGKSTLADVLLGLLPVDSGGIYVDGNRLDNDTLQVFRNSLSYVAQTIFILSDTVINNVAFGVPSEKIDMERVEYSLKLAGAYDFCMKLPLGLKTNLGQDGKLLSGGQRQRIGIARALYKDSSLLILDEPTSALDIESEYNLLKSLNKIKKNVIILIISHRPTSIKMSDKIVLMSEGEVLVQGSYKYLIKFSEPFKNLIELSG